MMEVGLTCQSILPPKSYNMKKTHQYLAFVSIAIGTVFSLSSCIMWGTGTSDPYIVSETRQKENLYYVPSAPNTPFHSQKHDLNVSLMGTSNTKFSGGEVQASYMSGNHLGFIGSWSFAGTGSSDHVKNNRFELGAGYVAPLSKNWHFESYAGFGNGKIRNMHHTGSSEINLTHFFIQPAIAINNKDKNVQFGFVSKFAGVNFSVKDTLFSTAREPLSTGQVKSLYDQPFHIIWEPGFVLRMGWKNFQFHTGYSFSKDLTNPGLYKANGAFSLGFCLRLTTQPDIISK